MGKQFPFAFCPKWSPNEADLSNQISLQLPTLHLHWKRLEISERSYKTDRFYTLRVAQSSKFNLAHKSLFCKVWEVTKKMHYVAENTDTWRLVTGGFGTQFINEDSSRTQETSSSQAPAYWWVKLQKPHRRIILTYMISICFLLIFLTQQWVLINFSNSNDCFKMSWIDQT